MVPVVINFGHHGSLFLIQVCTKSAFASFSTVGFPGSCICRDSRNLVNLFVITFDAVQSSDFLCNSFPWRHRSFTSVCLLQARIPPAPTNLLFQVFRTVFSVGKLHLGENLNIRTSSCWDHTPCDVTSPPFIMTMLSQNKFLDPFYTAVLS